MYSSLSLLSAFFAVVYGQGQPVAQSTTTFGAVAGCSGCYIIADVNQVIFADYTVTQTNTAVVSQGVGRNGSVVVTSFNQPLGQFSFNPNGLLSGQPVTGAYVPLTGTVITLNGNTFTSPTAYNVFTGYTEFQLTPNGDTCSTSTLPAVSVSPVQIQMNGGPDAVLAAESQFIAGLPALTCEAGGAVISTTVPVPAVVTTTTSTTTGIFRPTPIAASQTSSSSSAAAAAAATTSAPSSSAATTSDSGIVISMNPSASGSPASISVMQGAAAAFRAYSTSLPAGLFVALFALPGLGAWIL